MILNRSQSSESPLHGGKAALQCLGHFRLCLTAWPVKHLPADPGEVQVSNLPLAQEPLAEFGQLIPAIGQVVSADLRQADWYHGHASPLSVGS